MSDSLRARVNELLAGVLTSDGIEAWWDLKIPALANRSPNEMVEIDGAMLLALAESYRDPAFS